jgi:hypothetical protein
MNKIKIKNKKLKEASLGFILWKLESIEKFYPCYTRLIKEKR